MVTEVGEFIAEVYDVVHPPDGNLQEAGLNVPPALLSLHVTLPDGVVGETEVSATIAAYVNWVPELIAAEFGVTVVVVECFTANIAVPVLLECVLSPVYVAFIVTADAFAAGVYDVEHPPDGNVQEVVVKIP